MANIKPTSEWLAELEETYHDLWARALSARQTWFEAQVAAAEFAEGEEVEVSWRKGYFGPFSWRLARVEKILGSDSGLRYSCRLYKAGSKTQMYERPDSFFVDRVRAIQAQQEKGSTNVGSDSRGEEGNRPTGNSGAGGT